VITSPIIQHVRDPELSAHRDRLRDVIQNCDLPALVEEPSGLLPRLALAILSGDPRLVYEYRSEWNGDEAFHWAIGFGTPEVIELFLRSGFDPNSPNDGGVYPLESAAQRDSATVELLFESGAKVSALPDQGSRALLTAIVAKDADLVRLLTRYGVPADERCFACCQRQGLSRLWRYWKRPSRSSKRRGRPGPRSCAPHGSRIGDS
jgi:ankyrin repeat protein